MSRILKIFSIVVLISIFFIQCSVYDFLGRHVLQNQQTKMQINDENFGLYLSETKRFPLSRFNDALDSIGLYQPSEKYFIFFVHGMGDYPGRIKYTHPFRYIIKKYAANVVLFKWPGWINIRTIPRDNAYASGSYLQDELKRWSDLLTSNPLLKQKRQIMMTHSMGAAVLRSMMENYHGELPNDMLDALIIVAPETDLAGHARWVEKINFAKKIYIFYDANDPVLKPVKVYLNRARLGMQLTRLDGSVEPLAANALYIDVRDATDWHGYHLIRQNKTLENLFVSLIDGDKKPFINCISVGTQVYAVPDE